mgnify:CR=1 FL=1
MCMFCLTSCAVIFENNYDVMARHALFNLMQAQENYRMENHKYANKLVQLSSHGLKYNTGIVYINPLKLVFFNCIYPNFYLSIIYFFFRKIKNKLSKI